MYMLNRALNIICIGCWNLSERIYEILLWMIQYVRIYIQCP
jgi:hypothetical protein